jgi:hypothetical protein
LLELLVDLLLLLRRFGLDVEVEVDQEIPGLLFHLRELAVDRYAPESINTLQAVKVVNSHSVFPLWLKGFLFLVHDEEEFLEATEAPEVHLIWVEVLVAAKYLLEDLVADFII